MHAFSELIAYLLDKKGFKYVLTSKANNDSIEKRFSFNKYLSRNQLVLDLSTFSHNKYTLLLSARSNLYSNANDSLNKPLYKSTFNEAQLIIKTLEREESQKLKSKLKF